MVTANNYKAQNPKNRYAKSCKRTLLAIDICFCSDKGSHNKGLSDYLSYVYVKGKKEVCFSQSHV